MLANQYNHNAILLLSKLCIELPCNFPLLYSESTIPQGIRFSSANHQILQLFDYGLLLDWISLWTTNDFRCHTHQYWHWNPNWYFLGISIFLLCDTKLDWKDFGVLNKSMIVRETCLNALPLCRSLVVPNITEPPLTIIDLKNSSQRSEIFQNHSFHCSIDYMNTIFFVIVKRAAADLKVRTWLIRKLYHAKPS